MTPKWDNSICHSLHLKAALTDTRSSLLRHCCDTGAGAQLPVELSWACNHYSSAAYAAFPTNETMRCMFDSEYNVFTGGNNTNYPGCGSCLCCKPLGRCGVLVLAMGVPRQMYRLTSLHYDSCLYIRPWRNGIPYPQVQPSCVGSFQCLYPWQT